MNFGEPFQNRLQGAVQQQAARIPHHAGHHHRRGVGHHDAGHRPGVEAEHPGRNQRDGLQHDYDSPGRRHARRRAARRRRHGVAQAEGPGGYPQQHAASSPTVSPSVNSAGQAIVGANNTPDDHLRRQHRLSGNPPLPHRRRRHLLRAGHPHRGEGLPGGPDGWSTSSSPTARTP